MSGGATEALTEGALRIVEATGPVGAIVVAVLVGLVLGALIIFYFARLFTTAKTDKQQGAFQERLIAVLDKVAASEMAWRKEVDLLQEKNASLKDTVRELTASVDLMRMQTRRLLEMLRAVMEGRLAPSAISSSDLGEVAG